jgi:formate dehydrogenase subunit gamma
MDQKIIRMKMTERRIERFSFIERMMHWLAALSFLYAALTGLALWSHRLYWLAAVFGGGETVRGWHPWGGIVFTLTIGYMFQNWARQMKLDREDIQWLRRAHRYAIHDDKDLPEANKFNAGQKLLFWVQSVATILLLFSGTVLWWPHSMSQDFRLLAILIHPISAILSIGAIIVHIYMGTAAVPGAFRGMIQGWVRPEWASSHHPKWFREILKR